jgi:thiamine-phosphate pyrophosphorylase
VARVLDLAGRRLYLCTPLRVDLVKFVGAAIDGGVDVVQLREKVADARDILRAAGELVELCAARSVPFILNDRPDLALSCGADGVHVGQDDAPVELCRQILGPDKIVGLSTHAPADLEAARRTDATYLSAGPVEATPTKPGRPGTGLGYAGEATRVAGRPVFVTGGVTPRTIPAMANAGVRRFVVVRYLTESHDPAKSAAELRTAIEESASP